MSKLERHKKIEEDAKTIIRLIQEDVVQFDKTNGDRVEFLGHVHAALREMMNEELSRLKKK